MKFKKFTALCLCIVLLGSMALTACKKTEPADATADEAVTVTTQATEVSTTEEPTETQAKTQPATTKVPETQPATKAPSNKDKADSDADSNQSSNSSGNSSDTSNNSSSVQSKPVTCVITVDGKDHKVHLGDTLTYTCYIKTPKKIENVQATLNYPGTTLELLDKVLVTDFDEISDNATLEKLNKELEGVFPVLKSSTIYNAFNHSIIKFNASNISGFDFTKGEYLIKLRFKVISEISGGIATKLEFMDEVGGNPYVENAKLSKNVEFKEELAK